MFWILLAAIIGSTIAIVYLVWRSWIAPWRQIERLVRQIGRGEQPRTFLVEGGKEARRVRVALENIFRRKLGDNRQIEERAPRNRANFSTMQDDLKAVAAARRKQ